MTTKFRKKPVVIDAVQFDGSFASVAAVLPNGIWSYDGLKQKVYIQTLEGTMCADENDWIIKGVKGEFYPCKPDIFASTYDPAD